MINLKQFFAFRTRQLFWAIKLFPEVAKFYSLLLKYNASINSMADKEKSEYLLTRENHVIEKGLSMRTPRRGFGQQRVFSLLQKLSIYFDRYKDSNFIVYPLQTIRKYLEYMKESDVDISKLEDLYISLLNKSKFENTLPNVSAGVKEVYKADILKFSQFPFEEFVRTRHSIRYFSEEKPKEEYLLKALQIAQQTPSACNRQAWKTYIFSSEKARALLEWQGGARGFEDDIPTAILVTSNLKAFLSYEIHQAYVDGGMYSMNLIFALHSLGFGTIPLSTGFSQSKLANLKSDFLIPEYEVPIMIIGVGCLNESFRVAISTRKPVPYTNSFV